MAFDGLLTRAMVKELACCLVYGRVTKISAPYQNEVILTIRNQRKNYPLLLSAHPTYARAQITEIPYSNPQTPTNFTMVLRKYLESARLAFIEQVENDRVINFGFVTRNELGDKLPLLLSLEIMGRYSNLILVDQETGRSSIPSSTYQWIKTGIGRFCRKQRIVCRLLREKSIPSKTSRRHIWNF